MTRKARYKNLDFPPPLEHVPFPHYLTYPHMAGYVIIDSMDQNHVSLVVQSKLRMNKNKEPRVRHYNFHLDNHTILGIRHSKELGCLIFSRTSQAMVVSQFDALHPGPLAQFDVKQFRIAVPRNHKALSVDEMEKYVRMYMKQRSTAK